jgi:hypothetical protein
LKLRKLAQRKGEALMALGHLIGLKTEQIFTRGFQFSREVSKRGSHEVQGVVARFVGSHRECEDLASEGEAARGGSFSGSRIERRLLHCIHSVSYQSLYGLTTLAPWAGQSLVGAASPRNVNKQELVMDTELSPDPSIRRAQRKQWREKASSLEDRQVRAIEDLADALDEILFVMRHMLAKLK